MTVLATHERATINTVFEFQVTMLFSLLGLTLSMVLLPLLGADLAMLLAYAG